MNRLRNALASLKSIISNVANRFGAVKRRMVKGLLPSITKIRKRATATHGDYERGVILHRRGSSELNPCPVCWQNLASKNEADEMNCLSCGDLVWNGKDYVKSEE